MYRTNISTIGFLLAVMCGCTTVITSKPPTDMSEFAEIDVAFDGRPDLTIFRILALDEHALEDYGNDDKKPRRFWLRSGKYQATLNCDKQITLPNGHAYHSVLTDISPKFEFEVEAGDRYVLGCNPTSESDGYYLRKQRFQER